MLTKEELADLRAKEEALANAAFIAIASPQTVIKLLDMIDRLEKEADWLAKQCSDTIDHAGITAWRHIASIYTTGN